MTNEEIKEGNKLIAEFMGYKTDHIVWWHEDKSVMTDASLVKYHSSYDWLMPAYKKLRKLWNKIFDTHFNFLFERLTSSILIDDILEVFKNLVECIEWYKTQKSHE